MANEVVKYHNEMNTVPLRNFNKNELDIFMSICSRIKEKNIDRVEFSFEYLKELVKWKDTDYNSFVRSLDSTYKKLINCDMKIGDEKNWVRFVLFTEYEIDLTKHTINVKINERFKWVLNFLGDNFTRFELEEFVDFKSSYTKVFFKNMKQYKTTGKWVISLEDFRRLLDIPEKYKITHIDSRVLKPILEELGTKYHLKINKKYSNQGKGRPQVVGFEFTFLKEKIKLKEDKGKIIYETNLEFNEDKYKFRTLKLFDKKYNRDNYVKIISVIKNPNNTVTVKYKNLDDDFINQAYFDSLIIWENYFLKNVI